MAMVIATLSFIGWVIVFTSSFLIDQFELLGLLPVTNNLAGREMPAPVFRTPFYYRFIWHPIYLGFIIAFWAAPTMSAGHLLFDGGHGLHLHRHHARRARSRRDVR